MKKIFGIILGLFFVFGNLSSQIRFTSDSMYIWTNLADDVISIKNFRTAKCGNNSYSIFQGQDEGSFIFSNSDSLRLLRPFPESDLGFWTNNILRSRWRNLESLKSIIKKNLSPVLKEKWGNYWEDNTPIMLFIFFIDMTGKVREMYLSYMSILDDDLPICVIDKIFQEVLSGDFYIDFNSDMKELKRANWMQARCSFGSEQLLK
ncbi:hypothetical protein [Bacteroides nordii]|uniref:hypothetical protein n=1 Tax=Bacteroides nordii TaxID=291645 RepID=UPI00204096BA|nr:hypothetical protein [Bacteroides nordii]GFZ38851.1 hypothetical protein BANORC5_08860 [Bacteroides nordii]